MMSKCRSISFLIVFALCACKKDDAAPPAENPDIIIPDGEITFTLDGSPVQLVGGYGTITMAPNNTYKLFLTASTTTSTGTLHLVTDSLVPQAITPPFSSARSFRFVYSALNDTNTYATDTIDPLGSVFIVQLDTIINGRMEGIFSADGVNHLDEDGNVLSSGHVITAGSFSVPVME